MCTMRGGGGERGKWPTKALPSCSSLSMYLRGEKNLCRQNFQEKQENETLAWLFLLRRVIQNPKHSFNYGNLCTNQQRNVNSN